MKPIKTTIERAKDAAKTWNEYRQQNMGKRFTKSQFMYDRLPYSGVAPKFLLETDLYLKPVDSRNNGNIVYYEFTDHPIHYSVFIKAIKLLYQIQNKNKLEATNETTNNQNHNYPNIKMNDEGGWYTEKTDEKEYPTADNNGKLIWDKVHDLAIINQVKYRKLYHKIFEWDMFSTDELVCEIINRNKIYDLKELWLEYFTPAKCVEILRSQGYEVTAKKTIEL